MNPNTINLITFVEGLVALAAKSVVDLKNVLTSGDSSTVDATLADADAQYQKLIANVKGS